MPGTGSGTGHEVTACEAFRGYRLFLNWFFASTMFLTRPLRLTKE